MELVIMGVVAILYGYQIYSSYNPTIEDLIEKKRQHDLKIEYYTSVMIETDKVNEWEERCLSAGII
jgi:hypothetical protein